VRGVEPLACLREARQQHPNDMMLHTPREAPIRSEPGGHLKREQ